MIKIFFSRFSLFWITYFSLLFLCALGGIFIIPSGNDIFWLWAWIFYVPFLFCFVYLYGFLMGIWVQSKLTGTRKEILLLSIIYFILMLLLLMICGLDGILKNGILYNIDIEFYPALGSTLLFVLGAFIVKFKQQK